MTPSSVAAHAGDRRRVVIAVPQPRRSWPVERLRQPEVQHLHRAVLANLDVGWLQVPMDDPLLVRRFERLGDLRRHRQRLVDRNGPPRDPIGERRAFDQLHHQRVQAAGIFEAMDLRDVRMIECRKELRFPAEPCKAIGIVGDGGQQDFDRDVAIQLRIEGAIDLAHTAGADQTSDLVGAEPRASLEPHNAVGDV